MKGKCNQFAKGRFQFLFLWFFWSKAEKYFLRFWQTLFVQKPLLWFYESVAHRWWLEREREGKREREREKREGERERKNQNWKYERKQRIGTTPVWMRKNPFLYGHNVSLHAKHINEMVWSSEELGNSCRYSEMWVQILSHLKY